MGAKQALHREQCLYIFSYFLVDVNRETSRYKSKQKQRCMHGLKCMQKHIHSENGYERPKERCISDKSQSKNKKQHRKYRKTNNSSLDKLLDIPTLWDVVVL
jgi:hypothetical protein